MRAAILISTLLISTTAIAETVFIEPTQDNTLYQHAQGSVSNGSGDHLLVGRTAGGDIRRGLISFKNLGAIPDHAVIQSVKLHLNLSREESSPTTISLHRVSADWCEGGSDAAGEEDEGAGAQAGDATWIYRFWPDVAWNVPGGDFSGVSSGQASVDAAGAYTIGSSSGMIADVVQWKEHPENNFGWILIANENASTVKRFDSRSHPDETSRPLLEVQYTLTGSAFDFSGLWYDPSRSGEGYNVYKTPFGWLIYYFGYSAAGEFLWITSDLVSVQELVFHEPIELPMLIGVPGTFENPTPASGLQPYGTLSVIFNDCTTGTFTLNGLDGEKVSNVVKLVGVEDTQCR